MIENELLKSFFNISVMISISEQERISCEPESSFVGCEGFKEFVEYRVGGPGSLSCNIYNHGDNYNYKKVPYRTNLISLRFFGRTLKY